MAKRKLLYVGNYDSPGSCNDRVSLLQPADTVTATYMARNGERKMIQGDSV